MDQRDPISRLGLGIRLRLGLGLGLGHLSERREALVVGFGVATIEHHMGICEGA